MCHSFRKRCRVAELLTWLGDVRLAFYVLSLRVTFMLERLYETSLPFRLRSNPAPRQTKTVRHPTKQSRCAGPFPVARLRNWIVATGRLLQHCPAYPRSSCARTHCGPSDTG